MFHVDGNGAILRLICESKKKIGHLKWKTKDVSSWSLSFLAVHDSTVIKKLYFSKNLFLDLGIEPCL